MIIHMQNIEKVFSKVWKSERNSAKPLSNNKVNLSLKLMEHDWHNVILSLSTWLTSIPAIILGTEEANTLEDFLNSKKVSVTCSHKSFDFLVLC